MPDETTADGVDVPIDDLFEALAQAENRYVLAYVVETEGPVDVGELVEYVVERTECPSGLSDDEFAEQVRSRLEETALPTLDRVGLVAYDDAEAVVRPTDATETAAPHLDLALGEDR